VACFERTVKLCKAHHISCGVNARYASEFTKTAQTIAYNSGTSLSEAHHMHQEWLDYVRRIDLNAPLTLVIAAAAVSSVITLTWVSARDARARKGQRRDTALELALSLESYARACRTMMHKASWAASQPIGAMSREASSAVSIPTFAYPEKLEWRVMSRRATSELREFPATVHAAREHIEAFREFGDPLDLCEQVEYECAKVATAALALARTTRRRHSAARWKPGAKDASLDRELNDFIVSAEEKRKVSLERRSEPPTDRRVDPQPLKQVLRA
jgi:hypothetical protein